MVGGFDDTMRSPGVLPVLVSLLPTKHLETQRLAPGVLLAPQLPGEGSPDSRNWNHHQKRSVKALENLKPGECCLQRALHESNHCFLGEAVL